MVTCQKMAKSLLIFFSCLNKFFNFIQVYCSQLWHILVNSMQTQFLYLMYVKCCNNFIMLDNKTNATPYQERMTAQMEVYLELSNNLKLNRYTIRASILQNNVETEVFNYSPPDDRPTKGEFKQIPTTFSLVVKFQVKRYLVVSILERETRQLFGKMEQLTVSELFSSRRQGVIKKLMSGQRQVGKILLHYESKGEETQKIRLHLESEEIKAKSNCLCFYDSYYFTITKRLYGRELQIYSSKPTMSPSDSFQMIEISSRKLCNNNLTQDFFINFKNQSNRSLIGSARCSMADLQHSNIFSVENGKQNKGRVKVKHQKMERQYQFSQFFTSGMQMALLIGIDFTISNGPFREKQSLHYFTETHKSFYEIALQNVSGILLDFDYDKEVPVYGFGAKVKYKQINSGNQTLFCFPLTGIMNDHNFKEVDGIIAGYRSCLPFLTLHGPTLLAPIIRQSILVSRDMQKQGRQYMILMLVTDGDLDDYDQVADLIVQCSHLPISIIIIGITRDRNQRWPIMKKLDNNNLTLTNSLGKKAQRDVLKFVEFMKCYQTPGQLQKQVLEELPRQVEEYHRLVKKVPADYRKFLKKPDLDEAQQRDEQEEIERLRNLSMRSNRNNLRQKQTHHSMSSPIQSNHKKSRKMQSQRERSNEFHQRNKIKQQKEINPERVPCEQRKKEKRQRHKSQMTYDSLNEVEESMVKVDVPMVSKYKDQQQYDRDYYPGKQYTPDD